ncbi:hypothetical protein QN277_015079 [Acacia crassicarpa]|uniref:Uncharacterized protein n=1 Tax=Acacia crassicarpa TaxID=499986 RepID=A0AAE1JWP6_9FABA|nr:hypothetical protein QN277_015079 [Acacia crassicarpa]
MVRQAGYGSLQQSLVAVELPQCLRELRVRDRACTVLSKTEHYLPAKFEESHSKLVSLFSAWLWFCCTCYRAGRNMVSLKFSANTH